MARGTRNGGRRGVLGTAVAVSAVVGIALGLIALLWPDRTLIAIATFFGIALIVGGALRAVGAIVSGAVTAGERIGTVVVGVILLVLGVIVVLRPAQSLVVVAVLIGIGWIVGGIRDAIFGWRSAGGLRVLALIAGAVQVVGGIVMLLLPQAGLTVFVTVAAILLIVVSVATLLTLPARSAARV